MDDTLNNSLVVFDLDGTLVDTAPDLLRALNQVLDLEGLAHPAESVVRHLVGYGARALIVRASALYGVQYAEARLDQLVSAFVDFYNADIAGLSRPFPGAVAALDALAAAGARLAVCTNKRTALSVQLLNALDLAERFEAIVGADSVAQQKPHPGHFIDTVSRAGGELSRALMVGDTSVDAESARAAGAPVVLVRFGYGENVDKIPADAVIDRYEELAAIARRLLAR